MITPETLKIGDTVAIVAPAGKIEPGGIIAAISILECWGLKVVTGKYLNDSYHQFAGKDSERLFDFQQMLDDDSIKLILCARGGYGSVRIIDQLDFSGFVKNPKWIAGFSDITVFHSHIQSDFDIETIHSLMAIHFSNAAPGAIESFRKVIFGETLEYNLDGSNEHNRHGIAEGILTGGNLSILCNLTGSISETNYDGKILFIEDVGEQLYHIDRMMIHLKRAAKLKNLAGLIVGAMSEMKDNSVPFGKSVYEIVAEAVEEYDFPVYFDFPAGHIKDNRALVMGRKVRLVVGKNTILNFNYK